ncbi:TolC family protein [Trichlorobacter sp.]|uniref:TolC family protein n=1 Tax=Trichlorobacter sp. TaxID=2911007 RepID=UPI002A35B894|nr:TolC family protein [Trichlorobacter sp.]MDY0384784.1 TolC family protein [Trichlorobacter sp.]
MRIIRYAPTLALCACLATVPVLSRAAESALTADMAVAQAWAHSPELSADKEEITGLEQAAEHLPLLANPVLELEGATGSLTGSPDERSVGIALNQELPLAAIVSRRKAVARAEAEAARLQLEARKRSLADQVRRAWGAAVLASHRLELLRSQTMLAETLLVIARERFAAGDLPEFEVQLADLDRQRQLLRQAEQQAELIRAQRQLALLMGLADGQPLPPLAPLAMPQQPLPSDEHLLSDGLAHHPDLALRRQEQQRDEAALALVRAEAIPSLTVGLAYRNERSSQNSYQLNGGLLTPGTERTTDHILGLKLSIPLPLFSRNQAEISKVHGLANASRHRVESARRAAAAELRDLLAHYRLALTALELHRTTLGPVGRENLQIQQEAFKQGEVGMQTVLDEKRRFTEQQEAELNAIKTAYDSYSRLQSLLDTHTTERGKP